jgi:signal transduction histidine kinase
MRHKGYSIWLIPVITTIALLLLIRHQNEQQTQTTLKLLGGRSATSANLSSRYVSDVVNVDSVKDRSTQLSRINSVLRVGRTTNLRFIMFGSPLNILESKVFASSNEELAPVYEYEAAVRGKDITAPHVREAIALFSKVESTNNPSGHTEIYKVNGAYYALTVIKMLLVSDFNPGDKRFQPAYFFSISELTEESVTLHSQQNLYALTLGVSIVITLGSVAMLIVAPSARLAKAIATSKPLPQNKPWTPVEQKKLRDAIAAYQLKIGNSIKQIELSTTALFIVRWDGAQAWISSPNKALSTITGYSESELEGLLLNQIVPEPFHKYHTTEGGEWSKEFDRILGMQAYLIKCPHAKSNIVGAARPVEVIRKNGSIRNVILGVDVLDNSGIFAAALSDVTELTDAIAKANKYSEEVQRINHIAVHDIKADLIALSKGSEVIEETVAEIEEYLSNNTDKVLIDALDTIKSFATLNINSATNAFEVLDKRNKLYDLESKIEVKACSVTSLLEAVKVSGGNEQGVFTVTNGCDEGQCVLCDESLFLTVLKNIVRNGFIHNESVLKTVSVRTIPSNESVIFAIEDNGVGFPPKYLEEWGKVLGKTAQLSTDRGGSGTGLYSIKAIMEAHAKYGGAVAIASELGNGTQFTLTLKAAKDKKNA